MIRINLHQLAWWKAAVNLLVCGLLSLMAVHHSWESRVLIAVGASGLSLILHGVDTVLRHNRDRIASEVLEKARRVRRQ